ncbi:MAG: chemotaxis protein CheW [Nitrospirae bacterium]|jgi:purine-binding chemotaxis protein CheW|nr:chemotaxis protein CheW [Nitrospirota bacterium]
MAAVETKNDILQLVSFKLGNEEYAVDILKVQEINRMVEITTIPNAPSYVEGVINLRGKVIPVINLRKKFGFESKDMDAHSRIIVVDVGNTIGLIVDSVSEVLRLSSDTVEPPPRMTGNGSADYILGIGKLEDRLLILLDIESLLKDGKDQGYLIEQVQN